MTRMHPEAAQHSPANRRAPNAVPRHPRYDGVICFGDSDWWYHNHGHYDMQMMRQFSQHVPVLYVNSIGLRMPRLQCGGLFAHRIWRKLRSLRRGLVTVQPDFSVFSPLAVPGRLGLLCSRRIMAWQLRRAVRRLGMNRPLIWVVCPPAATILDQLAPAVMVYQRTDRYETYPGVDRESIIRLDRLLKARADLTLFCSSYLLDEEHKQCRRALFVDHGVDFSRFATAGRRVDARRHRTLSQPATASSPPRGRVAPSRIGLLHHIPPDRPCAGFVGGIDAHTFDPQLFVEVARLLPDVHFLLVGACSLPTGWCTAGNVTMIGQQPYERVASYMAACDVLIMPWNRSEWIRACNPVKLKEYLAVGRPVVSTPFEELRHYRDVVHVATTSGEFASHIREALAHPAQPESLRRRVRQQTWAAKARLVLDALNEGALH